MCYSTLLSSHNAATSLNDTSWAASFPMTHVSHAWSSNIFGCDFFAKALTDHWFPPVMPNSARSASFQLGLNRATIGGIVTIRTRSIAL